jgi:hypothetical protein
MGSIQPPIQWALGVVSWGKAARAVKLTSRHLVQRSKMVELYLHSPVSLKGVVLN